MQFLAMRLLALAAVTAMATALPLQNETKHDYTTVGDMRFPKESIKPSPRGMMVQRKWPGGIVPYVISSKYSVMEKRIILRGLQEIERRTCVKFPAWTNQATYLAVFPGKGCWSYIGWQSDWKTLEVSLASPDCMQPRIVIHEVMHALGFIHEQNREDRDYNVIAYLDNAAADEDDLMKRYDTASLGVPYNVESVMTYGEMEFSKNGKPVLVSTRPHHPIDNSKVPLSDFRRINRLYDCPANYEAALDKVEYEDRIDIIPV